MNHPLYQIFIGKSFCNVGYFLLIFLVNFFAALLEGLSFGLILLSFSVLNGERFILFEKFPFLTNFLPSAYINNLEQQELFFLLIIGAIGLQAFRSATSFLGQYLTIILTIRIQTEAQSSVYRQIFRLSFPCVSRYKVGDLVEYARTPLTVINVFMDALNRVIISSLMVIISIGVLWLLSPQLTLITLGLFGIFGISQQWIIRRISKESTSLVDEMVDLTKHTIQSLQGIRTIYTFVRQEGILARIHDSLKKIALASKKLSLWNNSIGSINETIGVMVVGACLVIGSFLLSKGQSSLLPVLLTFITVSYRLTARVQSGLAGLTAIAGNAGFILRLKEILQNEDKEFYPTGGLDFPGLKQKIELKQVSLQYSSQHSYAVKDFTATIEKNKVIAIVGASGAGKSSIVDLLLRLYEPTSGAILVDGVLLSKYNLGAWRSALGVVSQDTFIFNESIEENIRFGYSIALHADIVYAAKAAGADEFIKRLPAGYSTVVGERGYRLSGGERQRLALARALLRNPEVLILDEATSNLDSHSEHLIQEFLEKFQKDRTVIIIAHRLSTIKKADQILVIDNGQLVESGSHDSLISANGFYAHFWGLQSGLHQLKAD